MKVNLGSAAKIFDGWLNVDHDDYLAWAEKTYADKPEEISRFREFFMMTDLRELLAHGNDDALDAIAMVHVLDHFMPREIVWILMQCYRCLKSGGVLHLEVENFPQIIRMWYDNELDEFNNVQPEMYVQGSNDEKVAYLLLGNLAHEEQYTGHKMFFTYKSLADYLHRVGFAKINYGHMDSWIEDWKDEWYTQPEHSIILEAMK